MGSLQIYRDEHWLYHHSRDDRPHQDPYGMHTHSSQCEILYILAGEGTYYIEGDSCPATAGNIFIAPIGKPHRIEVNTDNPYERIVFYFRPEEILKADPTGVLLTPFDKAEAIQDMLYTDREVSPHILYKRLPLTASAEEKRIFAITQIQSMLCYLYSAFTKREEEKTAQGRKRQQVQPVLEYIHQHLFEKITLQDISRATYIGKTQLCSLFKTAVGVSVYEYILQKRLYAAAFKIMDGISATKAAEECGFSTYSAFYKAYLKRYGVSPTAGVFPFDTL